MFLRIAALFQVINEFIVIGQRHPNIISQEGRDHEELIQVKSPGDDCSSQWGMEQSLKEPILSRYTNNSILIPNLSIYEN